MNHLEFQIKTYLEMANNERATKMDHYKYLKCSVLDTAVGLY